MKFFALLRKLFRNPVCRKIRDLSFYGFNLFYRPYLYAAFKAQLKKIPKEKQVFLMTRGDFGTILVLLNYIRCWEERRGRTCLVILTHHFEAAAELARLASPKTELIMPGRWLGRLALRLFREERVHFRTFAQIYARLVVDYPNALYIYPQPSSPRKSAVYSPYVPFFDPALENTGRFSPSFVQAYRNTRYILDYRQELFLDMVNLHYKTDLAKPRSFAPEKLERLKATLKLRDPYVVLNVSCRDNFLSHNRKKTSHLRPFEEAVDFLVEKGYTVVVQGRKEQPHFKSRPGLVDYARSDICSAENDLLLFSGCHFAITSKSGPENFAMLCNVPVLGVNYVELPSMQPNWKTRFFPKYLRDKKTSRFIPWKEMLAEPMYFDVGENRFNEAIEYVDIDSEELLEAIREFLSLLSKPPGEWLDYTPLQRAFKKELSPLHLDLYHIKAVPCEAYLASPKFHQK